MMENSHIDEFVKLVVYDHATATGLKECTTQSEIVHYAKSKGFLFTLEDWMSYVDSDLASLTSVQKQMIIEYDVTHWSWAFRQTVVWREMLME